MRAKANFACEPLAMPRALRRNGGDACIITRSSFHRTPQACPQR
jgi:hypothetical protein